MSSLTRFDQDGLELVIDTQTGEAFATIVGYARMVNRNKSTISRRLKTVASDKFKMSEMLTSTGFKTVALIPADLVYDWSLEDNIELARAMGKAGATVYLHKLAGYEVKSTAVVPQTYAQALMEAAKLAMALEEAEKLAQELTVEVEQLSEVVDQLFDYSSIIRVAKFNGVSEKNFNWRKLKQASQLRDLDIKKVPCPRYGEKNLYSHTAWMLAYPEVKLPEVNYLAKIN